MQNDTLVDFLLHISGNDTAGITFIDSSTRSETITYRNFFREALLVLGQLQQAGIQPSSEIVFQVTDNKNFLLLFWACLLGNIIPVPLAADNQKPTQMKLLYVIRKMKQAHIVTNNENAARLKIFLSDNGAGPGLRSIISVEQLTAGSHEGRIAAVSPSTLAYIQFSSGSTGSPKGVMLSHRNLVANTTDIVSVSGIRPGDASLSWMPLTHDMGMICFHLSSVVAGISQYIMPTSLFIRRPLLWIDKASEYAVTHLFSPNFGYHYFLGAFERQEKPAWDLSSLRLIYNGAEPISHTVCEKFTQSLASFNMSPHVVFPGYGMAEASVAVTLSKPGAPLSLFRLSRKHLNTGEKIVCDAAAGESVSFVGVGFLLPQCRCRIHDANENELPEDCIGNIQISGGNVTGGYYNDEPATQKLFTRDGWLQTGDLGFMHDGQLVITGRKKNVIIINGQNYYPQDIERCVESIPGLETGKVVACGVSDEGMISQQLVIFILFKEGMKDFIALAQQVKHTVMKEIGLVPEAILPLKKIPKTTSGKVQYFKLAKQFQEGVFNVELQSLNEYYLSSRTEGNTAPELLPVIWQNIFGYLPSDPDASFITLGLNSLQAIRLLNDINEHFHTSISIRDLFEHPSVHALGAYIEKARQQQAVLPEFRLHDSDPVVPLHAGQKRFWLIHQFNQEGKNALNVSLAYNCHGYLQVSLLKDVLTLLVERHESLRTCFDMVDGKPAQIVCAPGEIRYSIDQYDLSKTPDNEDKVKEIISRITGQAFDLRKAPLFRVSCIRQTEEKFLLVFTFHHLITDGWSLNVLFKEIVQVYNALRSGDAVPALPPVKQYVNFVRWYQSLAPDVLEKDTAYWKKELTDLPPRLELPLYKTGEGELSFKGEELELFFPAALYAALQAFCRQKGVTPYIFIMAALKLLLHKYTGCREVVVATNTSGRTYKALDHTVGNLLNLAILRTTVLQEECAAGLLEKVRNKVIDALHHQTLYLEDFLEQWREEQGYSDTIFDIFVVFQNFETLPGLEGLAGAELKAAPYKLPVTTSLSNLFFEFVEDKKNNRLSVNIRYKTALLEKEQVQLLGGHLFFLCRQLIDHPLKKLGELRLLLPEEESRLLRWGKGPVRQEPFVPVTHAVAVHAAGKEAGVALQDRNRVLGYRQLETSAGKVADYLLRTGIRKGDRIGIMTGRSIETVVLMLGTLRAGGCFVPVDPDCPEERLLYIIEDSNIRVLFHAEALKNSIRGTVVFVSSLQLDAILSSGAPAAGPVALAAADDAYILYTSGTSGKPKGVQISHEALSDYAHTFINYFHLSDKDVVLQQASVAFDISIEEIFPILVAGGRLAILKEGGKDIAQLTKALEQWNVSLLTTTPAVIKELNDRAADTGSLRILISGGDKLKPAYVNRLAGQMAVYNTYGPTESTVCATYHKLSSPDDVFIIGKPIANREIYICNGEGQLQITGGSGEIYIGGKGLATGYLNNEELTRKAFVPNPFGAGRLYRTGDFARWTAQGTIRFEGRLDSQVKINGHRVELHEIEKRVTSFGIIRDAVVLAENNKGQTSLYAFYTAPGAVDTDEVVAHLQKFLPGYMIPVRFIHLKSLPFTSNGKLDHQYLLSQKDSLVASENSRAIPEMTGTQQVVAALWAKVLEKATVGMQENFFESGGNSIKGTSVINELITHFNVSLNLSDLFRYPTPLSMSALIDSRPSSGHQFMPARNLRHYELTAAQKRMWLMEQKISHSNPYIMSGCYHVEGSLRADVLESAFRFLIRRHEILRTSFIEVAGEPVQMVADAGDCDLWIVPEAIRLQPKIPLVEQLTPLLLEVLNRRFDLSRPPLLRVWVGSITGERHVLLLMIHHIISDGLSMNIFSKELLETYYALLNNEAPSMPPLRTRYADYVEWQKQLLQPEAAAASKHFWHHRLKMQPSLLNAVADFSWSKTTGFEGNTYCVCNNPELLLHVRAINRLHATTSYITVTSIVHVLLFYYSGRQNCITVGSPFSGRERSEFQDLIGLFLNNVVVQTDIAGDETFSSLLRKIANYVADAAGHQNYPYDRLAEELYGFGNLLNPFYEIMVVHQESRLSGILNSFAAQPGRLQFTDLQVFNPASKLGLTFFFREDAGSMDIELEYNRKMFFSEKIAAIAGDLFRIAALAASQPEVPVAALADALRDKHSRTEQLSFEQDSLKMIEDNF